MQRFAVTIRTAKKSGPDGQTRKDNGALGRAEGAVSTGDICGGMHPGRFWNSVRVVLCYDDVATLITQSGRDDKTHRDKPAMR
jgi:hypothetical protein